MRNHVYFGSYSLDHWMKLLRCGDIVLHRYQRHFVWEKERVDKLVASIKDDLFIPQYEEVFKRVLARYHEDFREEGLHSYEYKMNSGRIAK